MLDFRIATSVFVEAHMASMEKNQKLNVSMSAVAIRLKIVVVIGEIQYILPDIQVDCIRRLLVEFSPCLKIIDH